jgi:hypothetical protein
MANTVKNTKFFYPPRPGNGAGTFSDEIVGLQTVTGGGLTQGNFEFTTSVTEKVNRSFNVGAFSDPISLNSLDIEGLDESRRILSTQFKVYPNYDVSQVLNFSMYGSLSKRISVSINKIINYFPASIDVNFINLNLSTGDTASNISYDSTNDETLFSVMVDRLKNPFEIDYTINASNNFLFREIETSPYRNLFNTYLDYVIVVNDQTYQVLDFIPSDSFNVGSIELVVSGNPFNGQTTFTDDYIIRPNNLTVDRVFEEVFDEVEKFLLNRLVRPEYSAVFQVPQQTEGGEFYTNYQTVTWPKDGKWNLDIRSFLFENYIEKLQEITQNLDSFKTNLISRFLVTDSLKEFDTLGQKVEKIFQIYGRSFDQIKQFIDGLAYMTSVNYGTSNDIPSQLLINLARTLGWEGNYSPITNEDFLTSVFGGSMTPEYPGYSRSLTPTELNYSFYRNLILNASYLFKSKGTRRSVEFLLRLIGAPDSLIEFNEHIYLADQKINMDQFKVQWSKISGGTSQQEIPSLIPGVTYKIKGKEYNAFTTTSTFQTLNLRLDDYPVDSEGYPKSPRNTETYFYQLGAGWYETTPKHRSPDEVQIVGQVFTGQNFNIQTQLTPFTYGQTYLDRYRRFPYMNEGFKLRKIVDNNKSWLYEDDRVRVSKQGDYNAYYFVDNEKLVINSKNIDLFLNPAQGLLYDVWVQSNKFGYPIPNTGYSINYLTTGGVVPTFVNPEPNKKTFFEFAQIFWENTINVRNRQLSTDGKTGGYPELQSIFWKYLESEQTVGIPTNKYTYQKLIDYINGIGPYWMKLVEQMMPATTIWNSGTRLENSIFNRQKYVYRVQSGCRIVELPTNPCVIISNIFDYTCVDEFVEFYIFPWLNGDINVSNFQSILANRVNVMLEQSGLTLNDCIQNSVETVWYVDLSIDGIEIIKVPFYTGYGLTDVPTNILWRNSLVTYLDNLYQYGFGYVLEGNLLTINVLSSNGEYFNKTVSLKVGIDISINCESN